MNNKFSDILDRSPEEFERPKPVPQGTYQFLIKGMPEFGESNKKKTPYVRFTCEIIGVGDDVDEDELKAYGDNPIGKTMRHDFYLTESSTYRLREFIEHLGIESKGRSFNALFDEVPGSQFNGTIRHEASEDGQSVFARIGTTAPVA